MGGVIHRRPARPRRLGLLTGVERRAARPGIKPFPYAIGDRIAGDLTVIGHLATGRHGHLYQVWSAHDWCAYTCKIVSPDRVRDRRSLAALRREARIIRRLQHPNVIRSFGEGEHEGLPYLLMEYLEGPSVFDLLERLPNRRFPVSDAVRTAIHAGAGLAHLHRQGWLHLDLKPANLLLRDAVPVLSDFDAARRIDPGRRPTRAMGTDPYMAPEHIRRDPPTPAVDVYGLAAVLYELLTGRWPFEHVYAGEEVREGPERRYPQLGTAPAPSARAHVEEISPTLDDVVLRSLDADPAQRPSLHTLLMALAEELNDEVALWPQGVRTERRKEPRE
jgi:eukaryotic-like serine/threonine-protein kinase